MSIIDWKHLGGEPDDGTPFLVYLAERHAGSQVHAATKKRAINGHMWIIAGHFGFDVPKVLRWASIENEPDDLTADEQEAA